MSTLSEVLSSGSGKESTYQCRKHTFHPWIGKIPWKRAWNPFQYSGLENPIDRGALWVMVPRVTENRAWLKLLANNTQLKWRQLNPYIYLAFVTCYVLFCSKYMKKIWAHTQKKYVVGKRKTILIAFQIIINSLLPYHRKI